VLGQPVAPRTLSRPTDTAGPSPFCTECKCVSWVYGSRCGKASASLCVPRRPVRGGQRPESRGSASGGGFSRNQAGQAVGPHCRDHAYAEVTVGADLDRGDGGEQQERPERRDGWSAAPCSRVLEEAQTRGLRRPVRRSSSGGHRSRSTCTARWMDGALEFITAATCRPPPELRGSGARRRAAPPERPRWLAAEPFAAQSAVHVTICGLGIH
jgi:hypothetical protein